MSLFDLKHERKLLGARLRAYGEGPDPERATLRTRIAEIDGAILAHEHMGDDYVEPGPSGPEAGRTPQRLR